SYVGRLDVTARLVDRWFAAGAPYRQLLAAGLAEGDVTLVHGAFRRLVAGPPRPWPARWVHVTAAKPVEAQP
ncbi:MAG: hypothetical protein ACE5EL_04870, partial [Anaerolineae bacterium]